MTYTSSLAKLKRKKTHAPTNNKEKKFKHSEVLEWGKYFDHLETAQQTELANILEYFKSCMEKFKNLKTESDTILQELFHPLGLYKQDTPLYVYTDEEDNPSCKLVSCAFGPTFPSDKYDPYMKILKFNKGLRTVLVLSEAPGTGKTNIAYHLAKQPNRIVLLVTLSLTSLLQSKLQKLKLRKDMDDLAGKFFANLMAFGCMLYDYAITNNFSDPGTSIIRFLFNGGSMLIGNCETFLQDLQPKRELGKSIYFMMDEVQEFDNQDISVPHKENPLKETGNAITLYSSCIRKLAPLIMTTTFFQSIQSELENLIKKDSLVYSYNFTQPLPVLHSCQVVPFLQHFITIDEKFAKNIWANVSYFIQGPFRRCEHFLQCLFANLKSNTNMKLKYHELIYLTIDNVLSSNIEESIDVQKTTDREVSATFHQLAVFGEATIQDNLPFSKYLLTNSISYTFNYTHKLYQVIGPIDQKILFNTLKQLAQQSRTDWLTYSYQKLNWYNLGTRVKFNEIIFIYYLLNCFTDILQEFSGSYLANYSLKASYYVKDIQLSKKASTFTDIRGSSLMINAMDTSIHESIMRNGLCDRTFSEMLIIPNTDAGPHLMGVLVKNSPIEKPYIPLICAATLQNDPSKFRENYKTTDIQRMYSQNSAMENNQPIQREKTNVQQAVGTITSNNKMLRILFHPNAQFTTSLKDRIAEYSSNLDTCEQEYSANAIMNDKGHLIYEISASNVRWNNFTKKMEWLAPFFAGE